LHPIFCASLTLGVLKRRHSATIRHARGSARLSRTYLVFGDIESKLDVLRVECTKCARKGRYSIRRLIEKYGRKAT
jgi:hypothetical protein